MFLIAALNTMCFAASIQAQTFVYSGREYQTVGRSYAQLRTMDLSTGVTTQLTTSNRDHERPWCSPDDGACIFFTVPGVWVLDIKSFDLKSNRVRTLISGVSVNQVPTLQWR